MDRYLGTPPKRKEVAYEPYEVAEIRSAAKKIIREAEARLDRSHRLLERCRRSRHSADKEIERIFDELITLGTVSIRPSKVVMTELAARHGVQTLEQIARLFFLTPLEAFACMVALVVDEGYNATTVTEMRFAATQPDVTQNPPVYRLESEKRRRGSRSHLNFNLVDSGPATSGRVITKIIAMTAWSRTILASAGSPADHLIIFMTWHKHNSGVWKADIRGDIGSAGRSYLPREFSDVVQERVSRPVASLNLRRLRRSHQLRYGRPAQNSQRVHDDIYVLPEPSARQASVAVTERGLREAVRHAQATLRMQWKEKASDSRFDTVIGSCRDFFNSPYEVRGEACTASFLLCFECRNATASPKMLPRLIVLHDALKEIRSAVDEETWLTIWLQHWSRLDQLLARNTTPRERDDARLLISDTDKELIESLLDRRLDVVERVL